MAAHGEFSMNPVFFTTPSELHEWLAKNHEKAEELWIGFHKKSSKQPSITYEEALDETLGFGWIDGIRKAIDETRYTIRFTPRKRGSIWSEKNTKRVRELTELGRMQPSGLQVFEGRDPEKTKLYSFENRDRGLDEAYEKQLRANQKAWAFFQTQPPSYQRAASWWVVSAKQEETRLKRLAKLIEDSENGRTIPQFTRRSRRESR